jgi:hypothetical protein
MFFLSFGRDPSPGTLSKERVIVYVKIKKETCPPKSSLGKKVFASFVYVRQTEYYKPLQFSLVLYLLYLTLNLLAL